MHSEMSGPQPVPFDMAGVPVMVVRDVAYASVSAAQRLDVYLPQGAGPFPLIVYVHGGAFKFGDKRANEANASFPLLLAAGYAVASINYRLSGEAKFPAQIEDVKAAVRWLRAHVGGYRLDARRFGAWGASAGGHLVSLLGTAEDVAALEGGRLGYVEQSSAVQAVVAWYPPIDFLQMDAQLAQSGHCGPDALTHNNPDSPEAELIGGPIQALPEAVRAANPITYIHEGVPPFLIQHGTLDCVVPPQQSQLLYDALLPTLGAEGVELVYLPGARHADPLFVQPANMQNIIRFFDRHLR